MRIKILVNTIIFLWSVLTWSQTQNVTLSGKILDANLKESLAYVNVVLKNSNTTNEFVAGVITNDEGVFTLENVSSGNYLIEVSFIGFKTYSNTIYVGANSRYLDLGTIALEEDVSQLDEVVITSKKEAIGSKMDKKTYAVSANISQSGGTVLQSLKNLPGITAQEGKVQLRGSDKVLVLIDGKQTAITGFGNQNGLDNIPASAIERIEIINNPSSKYDANGNAGIINIILKKENQNGFNGTLGITTGLGALWERKENLPGIRPQYKMTPKINPSVALNYRKEKINFFLQADNLYTETLNKNEFTTRSYDDGTVINQQLKRNRNTNFFTSKAGLDWFMNDNNTLTISGLFSKESIKDYGDQPFYNQQLTEQLRLWQFLEDEVLTAAMFSANFEHKFSQPGHKLNASFNYTFDREDEKYFFTNTTPSFIEEESFFLIADQKVVDVALDYSKPLKNGFLETGFKFRNRIIPTDMQFNPSDENSVLDTGADGKAEYKEIIPAVYTNYTYETENWEAEAGLRLEYVNLEYQVDPNHNTYQGNGYNYFQPFPNARISYKINDKNRLSAFYNRRVDRPDEVDIRIFPKYDDAEIIKVGNPALNPQFTNSFELGYKNQWNKGYLYIALYHRITEGTITRIATTEGDSNLIYNVSHNAGNSFNTGLEIVVDKKLSEVWSANLNMNGYYNKIDAFSVLNKYPVENTISISEQTAYSGNIKLNVLAKLPKEIEAQLTSIYLAPDIIPQGKIKSRFSIDFGIKKPIQNNKGELFLNATDLFNTLVIKKEVNGETFNYTSDDYYETQVIRLGYKYKF
ncbi:TonB-dependent receptor [Meridianimaribacter sp. CL38]|uniref:outer membrane beta-barrel family protein n=1 Tax=Meridianimaribacter sp. CL38 TaxID=2213021 RepID=UPI00103B462F|nr:outer membrane beta-barrel family protein [Meridianimaribacter sp. CL38]TBV27907.1 TonB-dependent receptor [Meridianimaribacter sp. CL38]